MPMLPPCKKHNWQARGNWRRRTTLSVGRERALTSPRSMELASQWGIACWTWWNWAVVALNDSWLYTWTPPKAQSLWSVCTPQYCPQLQVLRESCINNLDHPQLGTTWLMALLPHQRSAVCWQYNSHPAEIAVADETLLSRTLSWPSAWRRQM